MDSGLVVDMNGYAPEEQDRGFSSAERQALERQLVGRVLTDPECVGSVLDTGLEARHLDGARERRAFGAVAALFATGQTPAPVSVLEWLQGRGKAPPGFDLWLTHTTAEPLPGDAQSAAQLVVQEWQWGMLSEVGRLLQDAARTRRWTPLEVRQQLTEKLDELVHERDQGRSIGAVMEDLCQLWEGKRPPVHTIDTGWPSLNDALGGWRAGSLICVAARSSMGKTAFSAGSLSRVAVDQGIPSALWALEDGEEDYGRRLTSPRAGIPLRDLEREVSGHQGWHELSGAVAEIQSAPLRVFDSGRWSAAKIRAQCQRLRGEGLRFVVIDQLSMLEHPPGERLDERILDTCYRLKAMAKEFGLTVVLMHQVNRGVEGRRSPRPIMSDLKNAAVEEACDAVLLLFRPEYYARGGSVPKDKRGLLEVIVGKQRMGPTPTVDLQFTGPLNKIDERSARPVVEEEPLQTGSPTQRSWFDADEDDDD